MRCSALTNCDSLAGDSAMKGFAEPILRILNNCGIKVALQPIRTFGHIFAKPNDRVPTDRKTHAVYSIPCGDCKKEYLGQTKPQFCTSLKEHQKVVSNLYSSKSALAEHVCKTSHKIITTNNRYGQVNNFVWKPGILTLVLVPLIGMMVAICHKNIGILSADDVMLSSI